MAEREVIALNEDESKMKVPHSGDTYKLPADVSIVGDLSVDGTIVFADSLDITKRVAWDLSGITTATQRTITVPDEDITLGTGWLVSDDTNGNYGQGLLALSGIASGGTRNVGIGTEAGKLITTQDDNTIIGYRAARNSAVSDATAIGANALEDGGDGSVAVGNLTLDSGSFQSTAVGTRAGGSVTGDYHVFAGYQAGNGVGAGSNDVIIGYNADVLVSGDSYATIVGASALADSYAIAIGYQARAEVDSIAIGANALDSTITGATNNIAIGRNAGTAVTTGGDNIIIGDDAGSILTTETSNVVIGNDAAGGTQGTSLSVIIGAEALASQTSVRTGITAIGFQAFNEGAGMFSTAVGDRAGEQNTGSGDNNTFVGAWAGRTTDAEDDIVAVGYKAGETGRRQSVFIGSQAGAVNAGWYQTNIGYQSGNILRTGRYNTLIGRYSDGLASDDAYIVAIGDTAKADSYAVAIGYQARAEVDSIAIGANALGSTVTGAERNIAIGRNAGTAVTTGDDNIAIGYNALDSTWSGGSNIAIGSRSLEDNTTGLRNVGIGYQALSSIAGTVFGNVGIGYRAGASATNSNYNVYIGDGVAGTTNADHIINIGTDGNGSASLVSGVDNQVQIGRGGFAFDPIFYGFQSSSEDNSSRQSTLSGPSAQLNLTSGNVNGGDLVVKGGRASTTSAGVGGDLILKGGTKGSTGTIGAVKLAEAAADLIGMFGATPVVQPSGTGETTGVTAGTGTAINDDSTFTGNIGSTAYRLNDIVKALKQLGILAE